MVRTTEIKIDATGRKLLERFEELADRELLHAALEKFFARQANIVAGRISQNYLSGQRLKRRTGSLARSIIGVANRPPEIPGFRVGIFKGPALAYAGAQEYGTKGADPASPIPTIRPKKAKALAVPAPGGPALTPAGVHRYDSPRQFPRALRFVPFRQSGIAVGGLYEKQSLLDEQAAARRGSRPVSLRNAKLVYFLLSKIDLKPRRYLHDGLEDNLLEVAENLVAFLRDLVSTRPALAAR